MVRKLAYMFLVALSVGVLLTLSVVPHHHHDGVACILTADLLAPQGDCSACGSEAAHESSATCDGSCSSEQSEDNRCVEDLDFFTPRTDDAKHCSLCSDCDISAMHHFAAHFATFISSSSYIFDNLPPLSLGCYGTHTLSLYHLTQLDRICGLRAPPALLS